MSEQPNIEEKRVTPRPIREEQAYAEVGQTKFQPGIKIFLFCIFIALLVSVPLIQIFIPGPTFAKISGQAVEEAELTGTIIKATVSKVSAPPETDAVYNDFIMQLHLTDIEGEVPGGAKEVLMGVMGMQERVVMPISSIKTGDTIEASVLPWSEVSAELSSINGSSLSDIKFLTMDQIWADKVRMEDGKGPGGMDFVGIWDGAGSDLAARDRLNVLEGMQRDWSNADSLLGSVLAANGHLARRISTYETGLDDASVPALLLKGPVQAIRAQLGVGNEQAYIGRDGWLFFHPGVESITGRGLLDPEHIRRRSMGGDAFSDPPKPDPRPAILAFNKQLAARGIELVLMPTPVKPTIHPEMMTARLEGFDEPLRNKSFDALITELEAEGVKVYDSGKLLKDRSKDAKQYLATDTHWNPEAMEVVAKDLAQLIAPSLSETKPAKMSLLEEKHTQFGDIATMLAMPDWQSVIDEETVTTKKVLDADGNAWQPKEGSKVLLLGDSFTNIYSLSGMGWGGNAGFGEHLSYALKQPINRLSRNDAGAHASRKLLMDALTRDTSFLDGVEVLVWQFAERELAVGDWKEFELPSATDKSATTAAPEDPDATGGDGIVVTSIDTAVAGFESLVEAAGDKPAVVGKDDWMFLTSELRHLARPPVAGPAPDAPKGDPFTAIVDLKNKLEELDIEFVFMPAPPRAAIYPDKLFDSVPVDKNGIPQRLDTGLQAFYEALRGEGVEVIDLTQPFLEARATEAENGVLVCEQDTHWAPRGIQIAAQKVLELVSDREWYLDADFEGVEYDEPKEVEYVGDLVDRIEGHPETLSKTTIFPVSINGGNEFEYNYDGQVLLLADSHGLVFSVGGDMHTTSAGVAEAISAELGMILDVMARRGSGDSQRAELAKRFLGSPADAETKTLVIYSFAARTLTESNDQWKLVPLKR